MNTSWSQVWQTLKNRAPFCSLERMAKLSRFNDFPKVEQLNQLMDSHDYHTQISLVEDEALQKTDLYYESFIARYRQVPTRQHSWHDLYNGLIWMSFPQSKALLNRLHMEHIEQYGVSPRTSRRNRITHFDECGVILAYSHERIPTLLSEHSWYQALFENRQHWGHSIKAVVFGHANFEMLMQPFIGLTGKWLPIEVNTEFFEASDAAQRKELDQKLCSMITEQHVFDQPGQLKPLPLLGVPGWWLENQHPEFYQNTDYFRPKRSGRRTTVRKKL